MRPRRPLGAALALLGACRSTSPPLPTTPPPLAAPEAPAPRAGESLVRAREAPAMPTCEATDALTAARLTPGLPATPALARRGDEGLVAFVSGDAGARLDLLPLGREASPTDGSGNLRGIVELADAGASPAWPALAATAEGYLLAWRAGAPGAQRVMLRRLDARGVPVAPPRALGEPGWLGAPALRVEGERWYVAVARSDARGRGGDDPDASPWATHVALYDSDDRARTAAAPAGSRFDAAAPLVARVGDGVRVFTTAAREGAVPGDERALLRLFDGDAPAMVARDLDRPAALERDGGVLLTWRSRMTRHDAAVRSVWLSAQGEAEAPPITLSTWRGAFEPTPALAPLPDGHVVALTLSALADNAAGALNAALVRGRGEYVGRAPILTSFPARSTRLAVAAPPQGAADPSVWVAVDGRDADGPTPRLLLTRVACDPRRPAEALDVPPGTMVQDLTPGEAAPVSLARTAPESACVVRASASFTPHASGADDVTAGTEAAAVVTAQGAVLLAVTKPAGAGAPRLMLSRLDAQGRAAPARVALDGATHLLAAEAGAGGALAAVTWSQRDEARAGLLWVGPAATRVAPLRLVRTARSAAVVPDVGVALVVGDDARGATVLVRATWRGAAPPEEAVVATLRAGDEVRDAVRVGSETHVLLARPDAMGHEVGQTIARLVLGAGAASGDPFADPLGHARGAALWARVAGAPSLVYDEGATLRVAEVVDGVVRNGRGALDLLAGGGAVRSSAWGGELRWLALATGWADAQNSTRGPVTLAALDDRGEVRALTTRLPEDGNAIAAGAVLGARGERVVLLYPRTEQGGGMTWMYTDASCPPAGGRR